MSTNHILQQKAEISKTGRAALAYAERFGWAVLPVHSIKDGRCTCGKPDCSSPGKHPLTRNGVRDASKDPATIAGWYRRWPFANVAVVTGQASGFFVLDIDGAQGEESLADLERENGKLLATVEAITGGGGRHILFRQPEFAITNKVRLAPGLDVRGAGGYIVVAPSFHTSGQQYMWELSSRPGEVELAEPPGWVLDLLRPSVAVGQGKTASEWQKLATTPAHEGERNDRIAKVAGHILRRHVSPHLAASLVQAWNLQHCKPPLPPTEVENILESLADRELRRRKAVSQ
jgi:hypothetical protein